MTRNVVPNKAPQVLTVADPAAGDVFTNQQQTNGAICLWVDAK
jgi:hypothetical protein